MTNWLQSVSIVDLLWLTLLTYHLEMTGQEIVGKYESIIIL
jgi:hypothetical protein